MSVAKNLTTLVALWHRWYIRGGLCHGPGRGVLHVRQLVSIKDSDPGRHGLSNPDRFHDRRTRCKSARRCDERCLFRGWRW